MDGATAVTQLAHVLRVSAWTAREIAQLRPLDLDRLFELASRAEALARDVAALDLEKDPPVQ